jgi:hypothetical protein
MPHQKARQYAFRARWRPTGRARAAPAAPRGPTAGTPPGRPRRAEGRCALHRARGRGAHRRASCRPLGCRPRRRRTPAGRRCKVAPGCPALNALFPAPGLKSTKLFTGGPPVCVFITAGPSTKLFAWGGVFITAGPVSEVTVPISKRCSTEAYKGMANRLQKFATLRYFIEKF